MKYLKFYSAMRIIVFSCFFACLCSAKAQNRYLYTHNRIDTVMLKSKYFDFDRLVLINIPGGYDEMNALDYDVVYAVDAQTTEQFYLECGIPYFVNNQLNNIITVGICSPYSKDVKYTRNNDFLPNDTAVIRQFNGYAGQSENLAMFIKEELMPYMREHYRTTAHSMGIGHSLGASFMLHCFAQYELFDAYLLLSPNLAYGVDHMLPAREFMNHYFNSQKPQFIYFSDAGEERPEYNWTEWKTARDAVYNFIDRNRLPHNYIVIHKSFLDYDHWTSFLPALTDGYSAYCEYRHQQEDLQTQANSNLLSAETYHKHIELIVSDKNEEIYITGNQTALGNWKENAVKMQHVNDTIRAIDVDLHIPAYFKFTDGSWDKEGTYTNSYYGTNLQINSKHRKNYQFKFNGWMQ